MTFDLKSETRPPSLTFGYYQFSKIITILYSCFNGSSFFPFTSGEDAVLNEWEHLPPIGPRPYKGYVGLKNAGATCYMNSVIQQVGILRLSKASANTFFYQGNIMRIFPITCKLRLNLCSVMQEMALNNKRKALLHSSRCNQTMFNNFQVIVSNY